jgi:hypothetical protein
MLAHGTGGDVRALDRFFGVSIHGFKGCSSDAGGAGRALRVGVIGAGVVGSNHARVLAGLPDIKLVGVVDQLPGHKTDEADTLEYLYNLYEARLHAHQETPPPADWNGAFALLTK